MDGKMDVTSKSTDCDFRDDSSCYQLSETSESLNSTASTMFSVEKYALKPSVTSIHSYDTLIAHLKKENFQLKLRLYEMDVKMNAIEGVDSKLQVHKLQKENDRLSKLLCDAGQALDVLQRSHKDLKVEKKTWEKERKLWIIEKEKWGANENWEVEKGKWKEEKEKWEEEKEKWEAFKEDWEMYKQNWETDKKIWVEYKEIWETDKKIWVEYKEMWETDKANWEIYKEKWETDKKRWQAEKESFEKVQIQRVNQDTRILQVPQRFLQRPPTLIPLPGSLQNHHSIPPKVQHEQRGESKSQPGSLPECTSQNEQQGESKSQPVSTSQLVPKHSSNPRSPGLFTPAMRWKPKPENLVPRKPSLRTYRAVMRARGKSPLADANHNVPWK